MAVPLWRQYRTLPREDREAIFKDPDRLETIRRFREGELDRDALTALFAEDERKIRERYQELVGAVDEDEGGGRTVNDAAQAFQNERFGGFTGTESQQIGEAQNFTRQSQVDTFVEGVQSLLQTRSDRNWERLPVNARPAKKPTVGLDEAREAAANPSSAGFSPNIVRAINEQASRAS